MAWLFRDVQKTIFFLLKRLAQVFLLRNYSLLQLCNFTLKIAAFEKTSFVGYAMTTLSWAELIVLTHMVNPNQRSTPKRDLTRWRNSRKNRQFTAQVLSFLRALLPAPCQPATLSPFKPFLCTNRKLKTETRKPRIRKDPTKFSAFFSALLFIESERFKGFIDKLWKLIYSC